MNIFVLDLKPTINAKYHVDRHVTKMFIETIQLLCNSYRDGNMPEKHYPPNIYKRTHYNHPCSKWVRESMENYIWTVFHAQALYDEYMYRFNNPVTYGRARLILEHCQSKPPQNLPSTGLTPFALAMPDEYKCDDPVKSYRNYYLGEKEYLFSWTNRDTPKWIDTA